jgi:hypothetical protein
LVKEQGANRLIDPKNAKRILLVAIKAGAAQAIANANDLAICKKQQIRLLKTITL